MRLIGIIAAVALVTALMTGAVANATPSATSTGQPHSIIGTWKCSDIPRTKEPPSKITYLSSGYAVASSQRAAFTVSGDQVTLHFVGGTYSQRILWKDANHFSSSSVFLVNGAPVAGATAQEQTCARQ